MTEQSKGRHKQAIVRSLVELCLPVLAFTLGVGLATGNWPASLVTGMGSSSAILALYWLDHRFVRPRLEKVAPDWMRLGLEMTVLLLDHVLGAVVALLVCSRIFGFEVVPSAAWLGVAAMVVAFPIIHGTEMALRFFRQVQEKERREEQLKALATEAELKALKAQTNPHFLFNTLNTIAELIHADSDRAEATVECLAEMFRYVLNGSERGLVPLEEELAFLDDYLEIERVRFFDRLRATREIAPEALSLLVPSLVLQPLVENTIRYGRGADGRVDLVVGIHTEGDRAVIAISDQGPGMPARHKTGEGPGHGLYNVDQRLRKTYGEECGLEISANQPQGTIVTLSIPVGHRDEPSGEVTAGLGHPGSAGGTCGDEPRVSDPAADRWPPYRHGVLSGPAGSHLLPKAARPSLGDGWRTCGAGGACGGSGYDGLVGLPSADGAQSRPAGGAGAFGLGCRPRATASG